jgi:tRNA pseudouridine38/39 synthase
MEGGKRPKLADWASTPKNYICLKIAYIGKSYHGFAIQVGVNTVESELFNALTRVKFIEDRETCNYSRCGRTDKGVSALGNAVALLVRSRPNHHLGEYDYLGVLNKVLPSDIRVTCYAHVPMDFNARFSCAYREYKYFIFLDNYDLALMQSSAQRFIGLHDFRNFCKLDVVSTTNFKRRVISIDMEAQGGVLETTIRGMSFLWHQVRCMMAILMLIGKGLETPDIIDKLLDVEAVQSKPVYGIAPADYLVLFDCVFEQGEFVTNLEGHKHSSRIFRELMVNSLIHGAMYNAMLRKLDSIFANSGAPPADPEPEAKYVPLLKRPTAHSYDKRVAALTGRKAEQKAKNVQARLDRSD